MTSIRQRLARFCATLARIFAIAGWKWRKRFRLPTANSRPFYLNKMIMTRSARTTLILLMLLLTLVVPGIMLAQGLVPCDEVDYATGQPRPDGDPLNCNFQALLKLLGNILDWFVMISVPVATGLIVYAGMQMILKPDDPAKRSKAKSIMTTSVIGLVAILAAYLIIDTILSEL